MLVTEYLVGRGGSENQKNGAPLCIVVSNVVPTDCQAGRSYLVQKLPQRKDLIVEFVEDDVVVDWISLPNLPQDVVDLLVQTKEIPLVDISDNTRIICTIYSDDHGDMGVAS